MSDARVWRRVVGTVLLLGMALGSGCAKPRLAEAPEMPALLVPPPPPRVLPPLELEGARVDAPTPAPSEPPSAPRQPARPRGDGPRPGSGDGTRAETRGDASDAQGADAEAPSLQLTPPGDAASEEATRRRLAQASRDLQRVDYQQLNPDARAQYDIAKRFIALSEQAMIDRNLLFARTLADKAATIAAVLQRR